jgi:uncharacterized membrane protein YtjA (UPF0391 family)
VAAIPRMASDGMSKKAARALKEPQISTQSAFENFLRDRLMLTWAVIFFVIAIIAAVFGFTGIAAEAAGIAKILFYIFLILFLLSFVMHLVR